MTRDCCHIRHDNNRSKIMEDQLARIGIRVPFAIVGLVIACVLHSYGCDAVCGQSTLRVIGGAPVHPAPAASSKLTPREPNDRSTYRFTLLPQSHNNPNLRSKAAESSVRELPQDLPKAHPITARQPVSPDVFPALSAIGRSDLPDITPIPPQAIQPDITPIPSPSITFARRIPRQAPRQTASFAAQAAPVIKTAARRDAAPSLDRSMLVAEPQSVPQPLRLSPEADPAPHIAAVPHSDSVDEEPVTQPPSCDDPTGLSCPYLPGQSGSQAICGVDCGPYGAACCESWENSRWIPWSLLGPGEYVGPPRPEHVPAYYLRVNDLITLTYIVSRQKQADPYRIGVGDRLRIESSFDRTLDREISVQPDGGISLPLISDVPAAGKTVDELREDLVSRYSRIERDPVITITPLEFNGGLREILNAVTSQSRLSGQAIDLRVTPEGTIQAPGIGSIYVQGLAIEELRSELEARYTAMFGPGLLISPALSERATSYVFVGGEVAAPGRYTLEGPTTVMQAIALAGGWNNGGNIKEVVVFRRDENWCLKATKINVHHPLYGKDPCPVNDVWLRDNDLVIVPKSRILCAADVIELYFTRGVYAVFPITFVKDFSQGSTMAVPVGP
jgi:polysaccharide export outer membrane protein